jgi:hypothetical protein
MERTKPGTSREGSVQPKMAEVEVVRSARGIATDIAFDRLGF